MDGSASALMSRAQVSQKISDELRDVERQLKALDRESRAAKQVNEQRPRPHTSQGSRSNRARSAGAGRKGIGNLTQVRGANASPAPALPEGQLAASQTQRPSTSSGPRRKQAKQPAAVVRAPVRAAEAAPVVDLKALDRSASAAGPEDAGSPAPSESPKVKKKQRPQSRSGSSASYEPGASTASSTGSGLAQGVSEQHRRDAECMTATTIDMLFRSPPFLEAMHRVGVLAEDLRVASLEEFLTDATKFPPRRVGHEDAAMNLEFHNKRRIDSLALVLDEREKMAARARMGNPTPELKVLQKLDHDVMGGEQQLAWSQRKAQQKQLVLDNEDAVLKHRRYAFNVKQKKLNDRIALVGDAGMIRQNKAIAAGRKRQEHVDKIKQHATDIDRQRWEMAQIRFAERDAKLALAKAAEDKSNAEKRALLAAKQAHRDKVLADMKARSLGRSQQLTDDRERRQRNLDEVKRQRQVVAHRRKLQRDFKLKDKEAKAERKQRANEYWRLKTLEKLQKQDETYRQMMQLKEALAQRKRLQDKESLKQRHAQSIINIGYERNQEPGPGHYNVPAAFGNAKHGFKMGDGDPKTDVDWAILKASKEPGPGAYTPKIAKDPCAVKFGTGNPMSDLEFTILHANDTPSPGFFQVRRCCELLLQIAASCCCCCCGCCCCHRCRPCAPLPVERGSSDATFTHRI